MKTYKVFYAATGELLGANLVIKDAQALVNKLAEDMHEEQVAELVIYEEKPMGWVDFLTGEHDVSGAWRIYEYGSRFSLDRPAGSTMTGKELVDRICAARALRDSLESALRDMEAGLDRLRKV